MKNSKREGTSVRLGRGINKGSQRQPNMKKNNWHALQQPSPNEKERDEWTKVIKNGRDKGKGVHMKAYQHKSTAIMVLKHKGF